MNSNQPTFISNFSELTSYSSLLLKKESKIKMTKVIEWYEDFFWNFTSLKEKKAVSASSFPFFKDLKKNYYLNSMINKISDVQPSLYVSPWVLIHRRQNFTKLGVKKRNISTILLNYLKSILIFQEFLWNSFYTGTKAPRCLQWKKLRNFNQLEFVTVYVHFFSRNPADFRNFARYLLYLQNVT